MSEFEVYLLYKLIDPFGDIRWQNQPIYSKLQYYAILCVLFSLCHYRKLWRKAAKRAGDLETLTSPDMKPTAWKRSGRGWVVLHHVRNDEL